MNEFLRVNPAFGSVAQDSEFTTGLILETHREVDEIRSRRGLPRHVWKGWEMEIKNCSCGCGKAIPDGSTRLYLWGHKTRKVRVAKNAISSETTTPAQRTAQFTLTETRINEMLAGLPFETKRDILRTYLEQTA